MFAVSLRQDEHVRHYSITHAPSGWVARLEEDSTVRRLNQYDDWHRVERTREQFQREVTELRQQGWTVSPSDCR